MNVEKEEICIHQVIFIENILKKDERKWW